MSKIIYQKESYEIMGACFEVYKSKGCGFTEQIYQECLEIEFEHRDVPFVSQPQTQLEYRGRLLKSYFRPDFICFDKIIVELKAVNGLNDQHRSQSLNYLNATGFELALLVNFGQPGEVEYERIGNRKSYRRVQEEMLSWNRK